jgi:hypothetical protein
VTTHHEEPPPDPPPAPRQLQRFSEDEPSGAVHEPMIDEAAAGVNAAAEPGEPGR